MAQWNLEEKGERTKQIEGEILRVLAQEQRHREKVQRQQVQIRVLAALE
jgi:hypothetical protein